MTSISRGKLTRVTTLLITLLWWIQFPKENHRFPTTAHRLLRIRSTGPSTIIVVTTPTTRTSAAQLTSPPGRLLSPALAQTPALLHRRAPRITRATTLSVGSITVPRHTNPAKLTRTIHR